MKTRLLVVAVICLAIVSLFIFVTGNNEVNQEKDSKRYINNDLGVSFNYFYEEDIGKLKVDGNKIYHPEQHDRYIAVFDLKEGMSIEEAILEIVESEGKDSSKCKVVEDWSDEEDNEYSYYYLDLVNPKIVYSSSELAEIRIAEEQSEQGGSPFGGEWKKQEIYNKRLVEACSYYAEPLGLGTSKSIRSKFLYNNKNKFVFIPGRTDPAFHTGIEIH